LGTLFDFYNTHRRRAAAMEEETGSRTTTAPNDMNPTTTNPCGEAFVIDERIEPVPKVPISAHFFRQRYLYAFATQAEVIHHVRTQAVIEEVRRLPEILAGWELLQPRVAVLVEHESGIADHTPLETIPTEYNPLLNELAGDALFQKTFSGVPTGFALVEIDKLVAPQRTVNLEYVDRLINRYPSAPTLRNLLDICISLKRDVDPIQHLEIGPNTHIFSSPNSDIRFLGAFVKDLNGGDLSYAELGGLPAAAIIAFVGYGTAPVNVLSARGRIILNNGFHRVFALRSLGVTKIPVVVQQINNPQLEFPPQVADLPKEYLLTHPRPVLIRDFFETDFATTLKVRDRIKTVTVNVVPGRHEVPA
jgi:hypothetical protein